MKFALSILSLLMLIAAIASIFGMSRTASNMAQKEQGIYASCTVCDSSDGKACCPP